MYEFDVNNQVVSVNVIHGSVNATIVVLAVVSFVALLIMGALRYGVGKLKTNRKYKNYKNTKVRLNTSIGVFAIFTLIFGSVSLVMGSSNDDKTLSAFDAQVKKQMGYDVVFLSKDLNEYFVQETHNNIGKTYHNVVLTRNGRVVNCDMRNITEGTNSNTVRYFFTCGKK